MNLHSRLTATATAATVAVILAGPVAFTGSAQAAPLPLGQLAAARAALHGWGCGPIADEKLACTGFSVNLRSIQSIDKWREEDPEQIAYVVRRWFITVQPSTLSDADFATVKAAVAHGRR